LTTYESCKTPVKTKKIFFEILSLGEIPATHAFSKHTMLCKLWDAAANDTVGGREPHKGPKGVSKALMERYSGMGKAERKSHLAALK